MKRGITRLFADITARAEDFHAISVEGQRRDNSVDMQKSLAGHLRTAIAAMDSIVVEIKDRLGDGHD
jgi:hypothetical protein